MEIKQNPFSFYDFLGYFTPGALLLYGFMALNSQNHSASNIFILNATNFNFESPEAYVFFVLLAYTFGHLLSFISSITIERYSIWTLGYPSKYLLGAKSPNYFQIKENELLRKIIRLFVPIFIFPVFLFDFTLGKCAGMRDLYARCLDVRNICILNLKINKLLTDQAGLTDVSADATSKDYDFFTYVYHYVVQNSENHLSKMQNYVALYGFLRTLTILSIIVFWGLALKLILGSIMLVPGLCLLTINALFSFILYMAFVKFYRRFSLEALMALAVCYPIS